MVIGAPQQDRAFAVFVAEPAGWRLVTLGNDAVCTDAAVPAELFGPLGLRPLGDELTRSRQARFDDLG